MNEKTRPVEQDKSKKPFAEPRLSFVEPELAEAGEITKKTGFFGSFTVDGTTS
jgi:hypothetical protein